MALIYFPFFFVFTVSMMLLLLLLMLLLLLSLAATFQCAVHLFFLSLFYSFNSFFLCFVFYLDFVVDHFVWMNKKLMLSPWINTIRKKKKTLWFVAFKRNRFISNDKDAIRARFAFLILIFDSKKMIIELLFDTGTKQYICRCFMAIFFSIYCCFKFATCLIYGKIYDKIELYPITCTLKYIKAVSSHIIHEIVLLNTVFKLIVKKLESFEGCLNKIKKKKNNGIGSNAPKTNHSLSFRPVTVLCGHLWMHSCVKFKSTDLPKDVRQGKWQKRHGLKSKTIWGGD